MFRNSLITSYRTIINNRVYTLINLAGLVLGLTSAFILLVFSINETSYNRCYRNCNRIARFIFTDPKGIRLPEGNPEIIKLIAEKSPKIEKFARIIHKTYIPGNILVSISGKPYRADRFICADTGIFELFGIPMARFTDKKTASKIRNTPFASMVNTRSTEDTPFLIYIPRSFFENCLHTLIPGNGLIELYNSGRRYHCRIAGIYEDLAWNSTFRTDFIAEFRFYERLLEDIMPDMLNSFHSFDDFSAETFCRFTRETDIVRFSADIPILLKNTGWNEKGISVSLQSLTDIYLRSADLQNNCHLSGNRISVYTYTWLAFFILLLAGINYAILSTARSVLRYKEIGVRKVLGATRRELRTQLLTESVLLTFMAFPVALFLMGLIDPRITGMPDYTISMHSSNLLKYIIVFLGITIFIGIISGLYVAITLAGLNPINALKARFFTPGKKISLSKIFIVLQLFITLGLLICMITVYSQIRLCYLNNLSVPSENILLVSVKKPDFTRYSQFKSRLGETDDIMSVSGTGLYSLPSQTIFTRPVKTPALKESVPVQFISIDRNFFRTLGIQFGLGRDFDSSSLQRDEVECILNEEAVNALNLKNTLGGNFNGAKIVGIAKNFNLYTLHSKIQAADFIYNPYKVNTIIIKYKKESEKNVIERILKIWKLIYPNIPFESSLYKQQIRSVYTGENNFVSAVAIFTLLAFLITGMGLFGLALLISERRTKETAIRKVFGANNMRIIFLMQKEFLVYTAIATVFAIPVSWWMMDLWLREFYYRVSISIWIMLLSVVTVTIFVSVILLMRTMKVLRSNPVDALKYE